MKEEWSSLGMEMKRHPAELLQAVHLSLGCLQKSMEQQGCMNRYTDNEQKQGWETGIIWRKISGHAS